MRSVGLVIRARDDDAGLGNARGCGPAVHVGGGGCAVRRREHPAHVHADDARRGYADVRALSFRDDACARAARRSVSIGRIP